MNRKISLDLLRAIAIILVLLLHSLEFLPNIDSNIKYLMSYGWIGVDLFFVLSGYLIGLQVFEDNSIENTKSIVKFWIKRWTRTLPLYYFVFVFYYIVKPIFFKSVILNNPIQYLFLLQNYFNPIDFVQSWSLCIEEQFYFVFPILFYFFSFRKMPRYIWIIPALFSLMTRYFLFKNQVDATNLKMAAYNYQFPFHTHLDGISIGLFLAAYHSTWTEYKNKFFFLVLGIISLTFTLFYIGPNNLNEKIIISYFALAISFGLILIGTFDISNLPGQKYFQKIAIWSYGIYLWNNIIAKLIAHFLNSSNFLLKIFLFLTTTLLVSFLTYESIEKFGLKMRQKLL